MKPETRGRAAWPTPPDMNKVERILISKLSSIGDVVHALPITAALKQSYPHVSLTWVVEPLSAPMVQGNPYLDEVVVLPQGWRKQRYTMQSVRWFRELRDDLRARRFDIALDFQGLTKSALAAWASGAPQRYGLDWLRELAPVLETRIERLPESVHIVDQVLDVARFLGATVDGVTFPLHIPEQDDEIAVNLLREAGVDVDRPFTVVNATSGGGGHKGWGADKFAAALNQLQADITQPAVLIGAPGDMQTALDIMEQAHTTPYNLVGKTSLKQLSAVLRRAQLHLCGDTGSAHIAAALGTPVVSIFGRSNPDRLAPYGWSQFAIHHREKCAPVCKKFHDTAPVNSKQKCLAPPPLCLCSVTVDEVAMAARAAMARGRVGGNGQPVYQPEQR